MHDNDIVVDYIVDEPLQRNNLDNHCIDNHGKSLIDVCNIISDTSKKSGIHKRKSSSFWK